jgi:hypothetical protein
MDDIDHAQEREQKDRELSIANQRKRTNLMPVGTCYFCGSPLRDGALFCTYNGKSECRDDYERIEKARERNGW